MTYKDSKEKRLSLKEQHKQQAYDTVEKECSEDARRRFREKPYMVRKMERKIMDYRKMNIENAEHFGFTAQSNQLTEEMAELMVALNKYKRAYGNGQMCGMSVDTAKANVIEEIADVEVMLEQIKHLMGIAVADVEEVRVRKIVRTCSRRKEQA